MDPIPKGGDVSTSGALGARQGGGVGGHFSHGPDRSGVLSEPKLISAGKLYSNNPLA